MPESQRFLSALAVPIEKYIAEKHAVGFKFEKGAAMLRRFDSFVYARCLKETNLEKQLVMDWTARKSHETASTQCGRISLLRGLAEYMRRMGYPAYVYPRAMVTVDRYSYVPYIFSRDEIKRIFAVCDQYPPSNCTPNRHLMLPLLLRMLYGCGLRISEAVQLTLQDVDLNKGSLYIRNTKFNKERILPMADSLTERCREYCKNADIGKMGNPYLFPSPYGGHYSESTIYTPTYEELKHANWMKEITGTGESFQPTYEELKRLFVIRFNIHNFRFQPTYEELKRNTSR